MIKGFHWLTYDGGKFSTSQQRGIFADTALEALPADFWRWWLIANAPETADTDFTVRRFATDVNKDLADIFGNLANRLFSFVAKAFDGRIPTEGEPGVREQDLINDIEHRVAAVRLAHERLEFRRAAAETRAIWSRANAYLQEAAPWVAIKTDPARAAVATRIGLNLVRLSARVAWSIVPSLAGQVLAVWNPEETLPRWPQNPADELLAHRDDNRRFTPCGPLVTKISGDQIAGLTLRFGGSGEHVP